MITRSTCNNRRAQEPCASCRNPYALLVVYTFLPAHSENAEPVVVKVCKKCDVQLAAAVPVPA